MTTIPPAGTLTDGGISGGPFNPVQLQPGNEANVVPPVTAEASGVSAAVPSTSFDQAAANDQFLPYEPMGSEGTPNAYDAGLPSSSMDRLTSQQNAGMTGALNPTQGAPFGQEQTLVTVPVDKVMVSPANLGQVEPQMGTPGNLAYSQPKKQAPASTPSTATAQTRYGGQIPASVMPPTAPTAPASQGGY